MVLQRAPVDLRRFVARRGVGPVLGPLALKTVLEELNRKVERTIAATEAGIRAPGKRPSIGVRATDPLADFATVALGELLRVSADIADSVTAFEEGGIFEKLTDVPVDLVRDIGQLTKRSVELQRKLRETRERKRQQSGS